MEITTILLLFTIGVCAAMITVYYNASLLGKAVRALIDIDATSPETAMSFKDLDIKITPFLKNALRQGGSLEGTVKTVDGKYYINPDKLSVAKSKYRGKDINLLFLVICIAALLIVAFALTFVFPDVIEAFSQRMTEIFGEGRSI